MRTMSGRARQRSEYVPPAPDAVTQLGLEQLVAGVRTLPRRRQQDSLDAPAAAVPLWCAGDVTLVRHPAVAIIGTRNVTPDGARRARKLGAQLADAGVVVTSGLARGVDTEALQAALQAGGRVIAVIGTPIDKAYPAENAALQQRIYREQLLVSQFAPGTRVYPFHFPERNRLMAALTDASVIIEASDTSGTLHQAAECVRLGRWLFIANSILKNTSLTWPARFCDYSKTRVLVETADVLTAMSGARTPPQA